MRWFRIVWWLVCAEIACAFSVESFGANAVLEWYPRSLRSTAYSPVRLNDRLYAVGRNGNVLSSIDGIAWNEQSVSAIDQLYALVNGNGRLVAVGTRGAIWTSTDGSNWDRLDSGTTANLNGVSFGSGLFIAVGTNGELTTSAGEILLSADGLRWEKVLDRAGLELRAVTHFNNHFVALGGTMVWDSTNGRNWKSQTLTSIEPWYFLAKTPELLLAVRARGGSISTNGESWRSAFILPADPNNSTDLSAVTYGNGAFVAVGDRLSASRPFPGGPVTYFNAPVLLRSTNAIDWNYLNPLGSKEVNFNGNEFVVVSEGNLRWRSQNGLNWTGVKSDSTENFASIAHGNGTYLAVGSSVDGGSRAQSPLIATSADGLRWNRRELGMAGVEGLSEVSFINGRFVAISPTQFHPVSPTNQVVIPPKLLFSPDGIRWTAHPLENRWNHVNVTFGRGEYLALVQETNSASHYLLRSSDGIAWSQIGPVHTNFSLWPKTAFLNDTYFIVGQRASTTTGSILRSSDGTNWTEAATELFDWITDITFGNGRYVAVGGKASSFFSYGNLAFALTSTDGTDWTRGGVFDNGQLAKVIHVNDRFAAVGSPTIPMGRGNAIWVSTNGQSWTGQSPKAITLSGIASDGRSLVAVGPNDTIFQSSYLGELGVSEIRFLAVDLIGDRTLRFSLAAPAAATVSLESSTNLQNWTEIKRIALRPGVTETTAGRNTQGREFFRARSVN